MLNSVLKYGKESALFILLGLSGILKHCYIIKIYYQFSFMGAHYGEFIER